MWRQKGLSSQGYGFSSGHVWMWKLDCEESWVPKNWCFWTVVLERTLESPLDCKEIQPVHSKGDQPWDFFGRTDAKAETPVLWPPHTKSWLIGKDSDAGRDWGQEEKGMTEDEMAGWHHWLIGRESEWTPGVGDGQGGLACCDSWGRSQRVRHDWATELNRTDECICLFYSKRRHLHHIEICIWIKRGREFLQSSVARGPNKNQLWEAWLSLCIYCLVRWFFMFDHHFKVSWNF